MAITYDRPNVFGALYVQSGAYSGEGADFDIDLSMLGEIYSINITPTSASFPTAAAAAVANGTTVKVDFATAGTDGRFLVIGTRA